MISFKGVETTNQFLRISITITTVTAELMLLRNAIVSRRDFAESYAKPFKACAKAKALGVMCAYNQAQGLKADVGHSGHSSSVYFYANDEEILRFWTEN